MMKLTLAAQVAVLLVSSGIAHADPTAKDRLPLVAAHRAQGSIVAWGSQVLGGNLCGGFVDVSAGDSFGVARRANGTLVAWGNNNLGQANLPSPNADFVSARANGAFTLGLKTDGSIVSWGDNSLGQLDVPPPNENFVAVAAGKYHSLGLKADGSIVTWGWDGVTHQPPAVLAIVNLG